MWFCLSVSVSVMFTESAFGVFSILGQATCNLTFCQSGKTQIILKSIQTIKCFFLFINFLLCWLYVHFIFLEPTLYDVFLGYYIFVLFGNVWLKSNMFSFALSSFYFKVKICYNFSWKHPKVNKNDHSQELLSKRCKHHPTAPIPSPDFSLHS